MGVIHDPAEFLATFKVGDSFWVQSCDYNKPSGYSRVELHGYLEVTSEKYNQTYMLILYSAEAVAEAKAGRNKYGVDMPRDHWFLNDLVNQWHGVSKTESEAKVEYEQRLDRFIHSPDMQEEYRRLQERWLADLDELTRIIDDNSF